MLRVELRRVSVCFRKDYVNCLDIEIFFREICPKVVCDRGLERQYESKLRDE